MKINVELTEGDIREILAEYVNDRYSLSLKPEELHIQVKSKQNYRSEWEYADIRLNLALQR